MSVSHFEQTSQRRRLFFVLLLHSYGKFELLE
jgi:hypothetical protein